MNGGLKGVGRRLHQCRLRKGATTIEAAARCDITRITISAHEKGLHDFRVETLQTYCVYYGVSAEWLLYNPSNNLTPIPLHPPADYNIARNLRLIYARSEHPNQVEFGKFVGVKDRTNINRYLNKGTFKLGFLNRLCKTLCVSPDLILFGTTNVERGLYD